MAAVTAANVERHIFGNLVVVTADLSSVDGNDTWVVPHIDKIEGWTFAPTTEADYGGTISGSVITFASSTQIAGNATVWGK